MVSLSRAEGEKPRLGGQLLPVVFVPIAGASIRALLLKPPIQSPAMNVLCYFPMSSLPFFGADSFDWMRNQ